MSNEVKNFKIKNHKLRYAKLARAGSKWYKAKILLKKGRKEEARKLLLELSGSTGIFKERADKQLEKLD